MMNIAWMIRTGAATVVLALGAAACTGSDAAPDPPPPAQAAVQGQGSARATFEIRGMACSSCAATVRAMLLRTPGVTRADISAERAEGVVEFDAARVAPAELIAVVERLGYRARLKGMADEPGGSGP
jgi:copper chaperone CopZ